MEIWENVNNIKIKIKSELIYDKKCLKPQLRFNTKESFYCFYIPLILIDPVYRKDENYYSKVFLEKFMLNIVWRSIIIFGF